MYDIANMPSTIDIGFTGEKDFRKIEINMAKWMTDMPDGVPSIVHIRPGETKADAYIAATTFENNILTWTVATADLGTKEGSGIAQVWLEAEENDSIVKRGKSILFATQIHDSISDASEVVPAAQTGWLEQMTALKTATVSAAEDAEDAKTAAETAQGLAEDAQEGAEEAQAAAEAARDAIGDLVVESETLTPGSSATVTKTVDPETGDITLAFGIPKGDKGDKGDTGQTGETGQTGPAGQDGVDGVSPTVSVETISGGHEVTITDADGDHTFDVMDGESGDVIDDTAGAGDTDVTWSADKLVDELAEKYEKPSGGIPSTDLADTYIEDVKIDGTSVVTSGVANIPYASSATLGAVKAQSQHGLTCISGRMYIYGASSSDIKAGTDQYRPIVPDSQHKAVYYGLSKLAGVDLASETVTVGTYPTTSQTAIRSLVGAGTYSKPNGGIPSTDLADSYIKEPSSDGTSGQVLTTDGNGGRSWTTVQGGGGAVIDDTAGAGDTNKAWSADKLTTDLGSLLSAISSKYEKPQTGIPASDLASGVIPDVSGFYTKPSGGIPSTDLASGVTTSLGKADTAYQKPSGGIPSTDMASAVTTSLGKADTAYQKPSGGIPSTDMASAVQTSLGKADSAYQKPSGGIPASDLASGVIPSVPTAYASNPAGLGTASPGSSTSWARGDHVHAMPTAANVGAIAAPSSPATGAFLVYNGSAWVAQTLSTWQGGSY